MAGTPSGHAQPTAADLLKYGDLCEVSYDNFHKSDQMMQAAMDSVTLKIKAHMDSSPSGAEASEGPGEVALDLKNLDFPGDWLPIGYKFGKPWYLISQDDAVQRGQHAGLPIWQPDWAKQYWGYKDLWAYSGLDNTDAKPVPMEDLVKKPSWAGYVAYRKPAEGDTADHGELVIVFRGTQLTSEWFSNFVAGVTGWEEPENFDEARPEMGKVHKGFYHIYTAGLKSVPGSSKDVPKQVVEEVLQAAKDRQGPFKGQPFPRVTTVGHSLGGALATLCALHVAYWLELHNVPCSKGDVTAYTYDAPRLGNDTLAAQIEKRVTIWRVVNKHDIAPHVPPDGTGEVDQIYQRVIKAHLNPLLAFLTWVFTSKFIKVFNWHHVGTLLEYDPIELGHQLGQESPYDPNRKWGDGDHHNLQLLLYVIAKKANLPRAPTSINKGADILKPELNVPPCFWDPAGTPPNKGVHGFPIFVPPGYRSD